VVVRVGGWRVERGKVGMVKVGMENLLPFCFFVL